MDFATIFADLQKQAKQTAKELELEQAMQRGKDLSKEALEKLKTDRNTQIAATGAGALLLAAMLGTKGGRRFIGGAAKTGAVAGLGALAYKAWLDRQGKRATGDIDPGKLGFVTDKKMDPEFAEALVRTMVAAAWADGALSEPEKTSLAEALKESGTGKRDRDLLTNERPEAETLKKIAAAAKTPNHAAQIYAAACLVTGDPTRAERGFLARLAHTLGIEEAHAEAIRAKAV
ncbi:MAG: DUF533 domain-containing protein [Hyphomonas sp.]|uniref:tellurite resistance TerB family protein n=1 Tax=Hyphomonas sp. TaxID=87 RepID=UPI0035291B02